MSPAKKPTKARPRSTPKKAAPAKPARAAAARGDAKTGEAEAERKRAAEAAAGRPKEKPARKTRPARKEEPRPARKAAARTETARGGRATVAAGDAKAKLGAKYVCFQCSGKFYDLNKPEPVCPKCGADQRNRPKAEPKSKAAPLAGQRRPVTRPMVPLLEDEDEDEVIVDDELDLGLEGVEESPDDLVEEEEVEDEEPGEP
jgi:uncharacterized protein (TIGR02300 family)